jgi:hypothetical protein
MQSYSKENHSVEVGKRFIKTHTGWASIGVGYMPDLFLAEDGGGFIVEIIRPNRLDRPYPKTHYFVSFLKIHYSTVQGKIVTQSCISCIVSKSIVALFHAIIDGHEIPNCKNQKVPTVAGWSGARFEATKYWSIRLPVFRCGHRA